MQLQLTASSLTLNTHESPYTASRNQSAATGSALPLSLSVSDPLSTSPATSPVQPSAAGASIDSNPNARIGDPPQSGEQNQSPNAVEEERASQQLINELASRDMEVRQHELTHAAAGGQYAGAPTFDYERGPDGRLYAVGGEVSIDTSSVPDDPQATLEKAEIIMRAALAVADPSPQDRSVAAQAAAMASEARAELARESRETNDSDAGQVDGDTEQLNDERRAEELKKQREALEEQENSQAETLQEFNQQLTEVNLKLAEINQKLIDAGVFKKLFDEGFIFDEIV